VKKTKLNQENNEQVKVPFSLLFTGWTIIIAGLLIWGYKSIYDETLFLAKKEAYKGYEKDVIMRAWAASHGGVYVPISEHTQPNPYLSHIPERDIVTPSGKKLTLMNPAFITRETHEIYYKRLKVRSHITSLRPVRKANAPDKWETEALQSFEKGEKEYYGFGKIDKVEYFRYMAPLKAEKTCLTCHTTQGYKLGDIMGGISSSVKWEDYEKSLTANLSTLFLSYGSVWLIGFIGIYIVKRRFIIYIAYRDKTESEIKKVNRELKEAESRLEKSLTEKQNLIDELTKTKVQLEKSHREKDKFFSIISHDLRSPFQGFIGFTEILSKQPEVLNYKELSEIGKEIHISANNLYKLLTNLLEWSKVQMEGVNFKPCKFSLEEKLVSNANLVKERFSGKEIEFNISYPENKYIHVDENMLDSILRNLLTNAFKFTKNKEEVSLTVEIKNNEYLFTVRDTGIGMNETIMKNLFVLGENVGRKGTMGEETSGLGLLLAKEFVERHSGRIWAESKENEGTTFYFTIPYVDY